MGDYFGSADVGAPASQLWGSEGPDNYHGSLDVTGDGATTSVTVFLHTERHDSGDIDRGIAGTLAEIKQLVEAGPAPGPASAS
jgi:hypothetical protein